MLESWVLAGWRAACRDRLHAVLNVAGLTLGFAAAILIGLFVRDELSFDRFMPDHADIYLVKPTFYERGRPPESGDSSPATMAAEMKLAFPEIVEIARAGGQRFGVRHGAVEAGELSLVVDASFLRTLEYPLLSGDAATALDRPDSVVLSRALALKYFGKVDCLGGTLELDREHDVTVTGVLAEPLSGSFNDIDMLLSGGTKYSVLALLDAEPKPPRGSLNNSVDTFVRLHPGTDPAVLRQRLDAFIAANYPPGDDGAQPDLALWLRRLDDLHLTPTNPDEPPDRAAMVTLEALIVTGMLILVVAAINFASLAAARAARRVVEAGVRKAVGATQRQLAAQFLVETLAYTYLALLLAVAAVELALPSYNAFLERHIAFDYWCDPTLLLSLLTAGLVVGLAAGAQPVLVLTRSGPGALLHGGGGMLARTARLRQSPVVLQFAISIALLIVTDVIYEQTGYAARQSLAFDTSTMLTIDLDTLPSTDIPIEGTQRDPAIVDTLKTRIAALPGVIGLAGSNSVPNPRHTHLTVVSRADDRSHSLTVNAVPIDVGFFALYNIQPLAGRALDHAHGDDALPLRADTGNGTLVINEAAVRMFGFASAADALGHVIRIGTENNHDQFREIVGVFADLQLQTAREPVPPTIFEMAPVWDTILSVALAPGRIPETVAAIDGIWHDSMPARPVQRRFLDARIELLYRDLRREEAIFAFFALVAVTIGCLGLFGLSAFAAARRTKEIGIRKALGASTTEMVRLLAFQFARPVLLANLIAWPLAWWAMERWLDGFVYRITLGIGVFVGAGAAALAIAVATTAFHALQVARARPVTALRYE